MSYSKYERHLKKKIKYEATYNLMLNNSDGSQQPEAVDDDVKIASLPLVSEDGIKQLLAEKNAWKLKLKELALTKNPPKFILTLRGEYSCLKMQKGFGSPLFLWDISLLLSTAIDSTNTNITGWFKLFRPEKLSRIVVVVIEGVDKSQLKRIGTKLLTETSRKRKRKQDECIKKKSVYTSLNAAWDHLDDNNGAGFQKWVPPIWLKNALPKSASSFGVQSEFFNKSLPLEELFVTIPTFDDMRRLHKNFDFHSEEVDKFIFDEATIRMKIKKDNLKIREKFTEDKFDRTNLLLSLEQMLSEGYLFPGEKNDIINSRTSYAKVTESSPMFAVDCEMCLTSTNESELTSISVVDENFNVIYHTLVRPENKITNYLTQFSGITQAMLVNVETRLWHVQQRIRELLPPDGILVGHSLNADLKAIKIAHPYCIDTSVIYNVSGIRGRKPGLKLISRVFMNKLIQMSSSGHDPTEDAVSSLEAAKLKLSNSLEFCDAVKCNEMFKTIDVKKEMQKTKKDKEYIKLFGWSPHSTMNILSRGIMPVNSVLVNTLKGKKEFTENALAGVSKVIFQDDNTEVADLFDQASDSSIKEKFQIVHVHLDDDSSNIAENVKQIDIGLKKLHDNLPDRSLLVTMFTKETKSKGVVMINIKGQELQKFYEKRSNFI